MSDKVHFEITIKKTYEVDLNSLYRDYQTLDLDEALNIDVNNLAQDPGGFLGDNDDDFDVSGRIIAGETR